MESSEGKDYSQPIRGLVNALQHQFPQSAPPVMISYFTERAWEENLNRIEEQYANENGTKQNFTISFSGADGNSIRLEQLLGGESSGTLQLNGEIILKSVDDEKDRTENPPKDNPRLNTASLQMVMPMPLGERNEDGYRFELKRREDLQKSIEIMIWKSVTESCPRQLLLYSQGDGNFRLIAGVYRNVSE